jgi:protein phosphatase-4 regulatory subunit 3
MVLPRIPPAVEEEDEEDSLLESLVRTRSSSTSIPRPQSPAPGMMSSSLSLQPMRSAEKRRRSDDDDEEDGLLERLAKAKKVDAGSQKQKGKQAPGQGVQKSGVGAVTRSAAGKKSGDDPPPAKRFKMKIGIGAASAAAAAPTPAVTTPVPSEPSVKDGDTG